MHSVVHGSPSYPPTFPRLSTFMKDEPLEGGEPLQVTPTLHPGSWAPWSPPLGSLGFSRPTSALFPR